MRLHVWLTGAVLALAGGMASAQYVGPSDKQAVNVADILRNPVDDQDVRLVGNLLRKTGHERYVFADGTGEILVEIDDDDFKGQRVDASTRVEIIGEVDTGRKRPPKVDVDRLRVFP